MWIEINTGYSCYLTQNLQLVELETSKCKMEWKVTVIVIVFDFSIFTMTSMTFSQSFLWHPRIPPISHTLGTKMHRGWREGGRGARGGLLAFYICDPFTLCVGLFFAFQLEKVTLG